MQKKLKTQAENAGVEIRKEDVIEVELKGEIKKIRTTNQEYQAKKVILANGTSPRMLNIEGEKQLTGKGMRMNAAKDAAKYQGKNVYVIGGADGAVKEPYIWQNMRRK